MALSDHIKKTPIKKELSEQTFDKEAELDAIISQFAGKVYEDPRKDLTFDSGAWTVLFAEADRIDHDTYLALALIRKAGCRLIRHEAEKWRIVPIIDPLGEFGMKSTEEYEEGKRRWLTPRKEKVAMALQEASKIYEAFRQKALLSSQSSDTSTASGGATQLKPMAANMEQASLTF